RPPPRLDRVPAGLPRPNPTVQRLGGRRLVLGQRDERQLLLVHVDRQDDRLGQGRAAGGLRAAGGGRAGPAGGGRGRRPGGARGRGRGGRRGAQVLGPGPQLADADEQADRRERPVGGDVGEHAGQGRVGVAVENRPQQAATHRQQRHAGGVGADGGLQGG